MDYEEFSKEFVPIEPEVNEDPEPLLSEYQLMETDTFNMYFEINDYLYENGLELFRYISFDHLTTLLFNQKYINYAKTTEEPRNQL